jgi:Trypsin-co-occurring domain 1
MKKLLQFSTADGTEFFVEVNEPASGDPVRGSTTNDTRGVIQDAKESFDKALKPLRDISDSIINSIKEISNSPNEFTVELGLKFTARAGIILTSLDSEANLKIVLKWQKKEPSKA